MKKKKLNHFEMVREEILKDVSKYNKSRSESELKVMVTGYMNYYANKFTLRKGRHYRFEKRHITSMVNNLIDDVIER